MPKFEKHIFVCCNMRAEGHPRGCCSAKQSEAIRAAFKDEIEKRGLKGRVRANQAGCLDQCEHGPTVVVYPEAVWYGFVKPEDVPQIMKEHIAGGCPVARLLLAEECLNTARCSHRQAGVVKIGL